MALVSIRQITLRPAEFARQLLSSIDASEGRRRKRKRDTTADAIGLEIKRDLLEALGAEDPEPEQIEEWLLEYCLRSGPGDGGQRAMALNVLDEWHLAAASPEFSGWLQEGAPSEDSQG